MSILTRAHHSCRGYNLPHEENSLKNMATPKLAGKAALITGSSSGIGAAIAIEMCRQGAQVTLHGRNTTKLSQVAKQCEQESLGKKKVCIVVGDLVNEDVRKNLIAQTVKSFGKLDILVNNAGNITATTLEDASFGTLDSMLDIHARAPYQLTKLALPELIKNKGNVVNISTVASQRPIGDQNYMEYGMAKAALDQFTMWMARELGEKGVRVNSINPGGVVTDIGSNFGFDENQIKELIVKYGQIHALGRVGQPEEIAKVAVFLASEDSSFVTGLIMRADGGMETMPAGPRMS